MNFGANIEIQLTFKPFFVFVHSLKENSSVKFRTEEGIKFVLLFLFILEVNSSRTRVYEVYLF